jgi:hypothetical protein
VKFFLTFLLSGSDETQTISKGVAMSFKEGIVHEYSPGRDRSLEPLMEGLIKAGTYIDEAMYILRSNDPDRSIVLPYDDMKGAKLKVTNHMLERPISNNERVVKVITGGSRIGKIWPDFEQEPANEYYRNVKTLDRTAVINNSRLAGTSAHTGHDSTLLEINSFPFFINY